MYHYYIVSCTVEGLCQKQIILCAILNTHKVSQTVTVYRFSLGIASEQQMQQPLYCLENSVFK